MKLKLSICFFFADFSREITSNYYAARHLKVVVSILKFEKTKASKSELSSLEHREGKYLYNGLDEILKLLFSRYKCVCVCDVCVWEGGKIQLFAIKLG